MKILKSNMKGKSERKRDRYALYFYTRSISINASARDFLNDCDFIDIEFEGNEIIIKAGKEYKISKVDTGQRVFGTSAFFGKVTNIPPKTKLYGEEIDGALHFRVPKQYINLSNG